MIGIDLFAGAGGMSLGAMRAGLSVALAVEADPNAAATYQRNHPHASVICGDIRKVTLSQFRAFRKRSNKLVLFGGPPCQGFSYSNQRTRGADNATNRLFEEFLRAVRGCEPDYVVFENVKGITDTAGGTFLDQVLRGLEESGYRLAFGVLNAADFGVPQFRNRLFVVGVGGKELPRLPSPSALRHVNVDDALHDLPSLSNGASYQRLPYRQRARSAYARAMRGNLRESSNHLVSRNAAYVLNRYPHIPPGGNWTNVPSRLMRNYVDRDRCHTGLYYRLRSDRPSIVIGNYRKNMLIHPSEDRGLSVREAARLQSFPDNYEFFGSIGFQQQQVCNAVPPLLAEAVFRCLS